MPGGNRIGPRDKKLSDSSGEFCYMLYLIALIIGIALILIILVSFNLHFCIKGVLEERNKNETIAREINHTHSHSGPPIKWEGEERKFKKLHDYGYWEKRQKTTREKISSILPLFKEQALKSEHLYRSSIFSPSLFNNDELKTPNSPDSLSTKEESI